MPLYSKCRIIQAFWPTATFGYRLPILSRYLLPTKQYIKLITAKTATERLLHASPSLCRSARSAYRATPAPAKTAKTSTHIVKKCKGMLNVAPQQKLTLLCTCAEPGSRAPPPLALAPHFLQVTMLPHIPASRCSPLQKETTICTASSRLEPPLLHPVVLGRLISKDS